MWLTGISYRANQYQNLNFFLPSWSACSAGGHWRGRAAADTSSPEPFLCISPTVAAEATWRWPKRLRLCSSCLRKLQGHTRVTRSLTYKRQHTSRGARQASPGILDGLQSATATPNARRPRGQRLTNKALQAPKRHEQESDLEATGLTCSKSSFSEHLMKPSRNWPCVYVHLQYTWLWFIFKLSQQMQNHDAFTSMTEVRDHFYL